MSIVLAYEEEAGTVPWPWLAVRTKGAVESAVAQVGHGTVPVTTKLRTFQYDRVQRVLVNEAHHQTRQIALAERRDESIHVATHKILELPFALKIRETNRAQGHFEPIIARVLGRPDGRDERIAQAGLREIAALNDQARLARHAG